jgi:hypothetical protein
MKGTGSTALAAALAASGLLLAAGCTAAREEAAQEAAEAAARLPGPGEGERDGDGAGDDGAGRHPGGPEGRLLAAVNRERERRGLRALGSDPRLAAAAAVHSRAMAERGFFDHCDPDTRTRVWDRVEDTGYRWRAIGENVAAGWSDADEVVARWLRSSGHRENLLRDEFTEAGIGYSPDPDDRRGVRLDRDDDCAPDDRGGPYHHYWTMVFAAPKPDGRGGRQEGDR